MHYKNFDTPDHDDLLKISARVRKHIAEMYFRSSNGHYGGSMSCVEILTALYFGIMNIRPYEPNWQHRDRFVLSKGHCAGTLYGVLAERGFFDVEELKQYECFDCKLNTHPNMHKVIGLDISSGSLGHGLSATIGMALAARVDHDPRLHYCLMGDGECNEGSVWEAAMSAAKFGLDNVIVFIDRNHLCVGGPTETIMPLEPFADKWKAFGWDAYQVDGHDFKAIYSMVDRLIDDRNGRPKVIIADTIKGKGVSFMENKREWHAMHVNAEMNQAIVDELSKGEN